ncbi:MAG: hypothetical protein H0T62_06640 [Parachlamydiaceae bacterium]|nr:hypothetical protein [Parachlamydiaceae bacterium]
MRIRIIGPLTLEKTSNLELLKWAGRALEKHCSRPKTAFPKATGSAANKNMQGEFQLADILTHPKSAMTQRHLPKYGNVIKVRIPNDRGVRFSVNGDFIMFLEP